MIAAWWRFVGERSAPFRSAATSRSARPDAIAKRKIWEDQLKAATKIQAAMRKRITRKQENMLKRQEEEEKKLREEEEARRLERELELGDD